MTDLVGRESVERGRTRPEGVTKHIVGRGKARKIGWRKAVSIYFERFCQYEEFVLAEGTQHSKFYVG